MSKNNIQKFIPLFRLENIALAVLALVILQEINGSLWLLAGTFLLFDISAIGYVKSAQIGAITYNAVHNIFVPVVVISIGFAYDQRVVLIIGCYWLFHVAFDRSLGYGLKHSHSFNETHLGKIQKSK